MCFRRTRCSALSASLDSNPASTRTASSTTMNTWPITLLHKKRSRKKGKSKSTKRHSNRRKSSSKRLRRSKSQMQRNYSRSSGHRNKMSYSYQTMTVSRNWVSASALNSSLKLLEGDLPRNALKGLSYSSLTRRLMQKQESSLSSFTKRNRAISSRLRYQ